MNKPTELDIGKIWVYWDDETPHYIRAEDAHSATREAIRRIGADKILADHITEKTDGIMTVCWEGNRLCDESQCIQTEWCPHWRPDSWMEDEGE